MTSDILMTERYKSFPPNAQYLKIPVSSRAAALAGLSIYPACRPKAIWAMRALRAAVRVFGPQILPGPTAHWTPPLEPDLWATLLDRWRGELGEFQRMVIYHRAFRPGFALLLLRLDRPIAFVKVRRAEVDELQEVRALQAVSRFRPRAFFAPELRSVGAVDGWAYFATTPFPAQVYGVPQDPPLGSILEDIRASLVDLPRSSDTPSAWQPMHGDLTPWNLRQGAEGELFLFDWERAGWGPPGADEVLYRAVQAALEMGDGRLSEVRPEAIRYWTEAMQDRLGHPDANPLAPALERILRSWQTGDQPSADGETD